MSINIKYEEHVRYLSNDEWTNMINNCIRKIKSTEIGSLLLNDINNHKIYGHKINIINYSRNRHFQYPCMFFSNNIGRYDVNICIPDTPYFTKVPIMSPKLKELADYDSNLSNVYSCQEVQDKFDNDFIKSFSVYKFQPVVVMLFHELLHALRLFRGIHKQDTEEESTMYGIIGNSLYLEGKLITENTFRRNLGLFPRISHDAKYIHVYGTSDTIADKPKEFWKSAFNKIKLKI